MKKTKEEKYKINKTKTCFFKKFHKIDKTLDSLRKKKRKDSKPEMKEEILQLLPQTQMIYKQFYANRLDDLEEMDTFLET